jgi:hypothetical protein
MIYLKEFTMYNDEEDHYEDLEQTLNWLQEAVIDAGFFIAIMLAVYFCLFY